MPNAISDMLKPLPSGGGFAFSHYAHATTVSVDGQGLMIVGPSGSGKSALALEVLGRGGALVADDQTLLRAEGGALVADAHPHIKDQIEARGFGLLSVEAVGPTTLKAVIDLGQIQDERLPRPVNLTLLGVTLPLLFNIPYPHLAPALMQFLRHGWAHRDHDSN